jgi:nucleotide-binding universal stress UspA family protein
MARRRRRPAEGGPAPQQRARRIQHVLLASERRPFSRDALLAAETLAEKHGARVTVLMIMRIWGTGLGVPHSGLLPNRSEREEAARQVGDAVEYLERHGLQASGHAIGTRKPSKVIVREALARHCDVIVMGADATGGFVSDFRWVNEPYRVAKLAPLPVYLVKERSPSE